MKLGINIIGIRKNPHLLKGERLVMEATELLRQYEAEIAVPAIDASLEPPPVAPTGRPAPRGRRPPPGPSGAATSSDSSDGEAASTAPKGRRPPSGPSGVTTSSDSSDEEPITAPLAPPPVGATAGSTIWDRQLDWDGG